MDMQNTVFCQSCGMPLQEASQFGSEADGSKSSDYCTYCYTNGAFSGDMSMEEMIAFCAPMMVQSGSSPDEESAKAAMRAWFPKLKRWAAKP